MRLFWLEPKLILENHGEIKFDIMRYHKYALPNVLPQVGCAVALIVDNNQPIQT